MGPVGAFAGGARGDDTLRATVRDHPAAAGRCRPTRPVEGQSVEPPEFGEGRRIDGEHRVDVATAHPPRPARLGGGAGGTGANAEGQQVEDQQVEVLLEPEPRLEERPLLGGCQRRRDDGVVAV